MTNTNNISFEAIRAQMLAAQGQAAQVANNVTTAVTAAANTVVDKAKAAGSAINGVMPVTNNKLDARTEDIFAVVEKMGVEMDALYAMLGMKKPEVQDDFVANLVAARMASIKAPVKKEEVVAPVADVPVAPANTVPVQPVTMPAPVVTAPVVDGPGNPMFQGVTNVTPSVPVPTASVLPMSQPSDWHLGPQQ